MMAIYILFWFLSSHCLFFFLLLFLFCSHMEKELEGKTDLKDPMGALPLTLPQIVLFVR